MQPAATPEVLGSEGARRMCEEQEGGQGTQRVEGRDVTEPRRPGATWAGPREEMKNSVSSN